MAKFWIRELWEFTDRHRITIRRADPGLVKRQHLEDRSLNKLAAEHYEDVNKRVRINRVRTYLGVYWLSDITTSDGCQV